MQLYCDPASTTSRPVLMLIAELGLAIEVRPVSLMAGENLSPEFRALNPNGQVPVLVDGDFRLTESGAILRYLADGTDTSLVPMRRRELARLGEAMDWFKTGFSADFCTGVVYAQILPKVRHPDPAIRADLLVSAHARAASRFEVLDRHMLGGRPYLCGDAATLADLVGVTMVTLGEAIDFDLSPYPNVRAWVARMKARPSWEPANRDFEALKAFVRSAAAA